MRTNCENASKYLFFYLLCELCVLQWLCWEEHLILNFINKYYLIRKKNIYSEIKVFRTFLPLETQEELQIQGMLGIWEIEVLDIILGSDRIINYSFFFRLHTSQNHLEDDRFLVLVFRLEIKRQCYGLIWIMKKFYECHKKMSCIYLNGRTKESIHRPFRFLYLVSMLLGQAFDLLRNQSLKSTFFQVIIRKPSAVRGMEGGGKRITVLRTRVSTSFI